MQTTNKNQPTAKLTRTVIDHPSRPGVIGYKETFYTFGPEHDGKPRFYVVRHQWEMPRRNAWAVVDRRAEGKAQTRFAGGEKVTGVVLYFDTLAEVREHYGYFTCVDCGDINPDAVVREWKDGSRCPKCSEAHCAAWSRALNSSSPATEATEDAPLPVSFGDGIDAVVGDLTRRCAYAAKTGTKVELSPEDTYNLANMLREVARDLDRVNREAEQQARRLDEMTRSRDKFRDMARPGRS